MDGIWGNLKVYLSKFFHFKKRNRIRRYGFAILLVVLVFSLKFFFSQFLGNTSAFLMVSFVVALSAWYGGLGPGIFATILSAILIYFAFLITDIVYHPLAGDLVVTAVFIIEGIMISVASEARFEMEDQKDEFIGFVAHELKNPLTAVKGFSGLLIKNAKNTQDKKALLYAEQINYQSDKILELINDLLDITKIEIGKFSYSNAFFSINTLVKEVVENQHIIAKNRTIELYGSSKKILFGDRYRIGQVLTNLITNAIKYSPDTKKIIVRLKENKKAVSIYVKDYGLGIAREDQKNLFKRFYRTKAVQQNKLEGLGLGLYICSQIVNYHKGRIGLKSKEGKGSTFYLELPIALQHNVN